MCECLEETGNSARAFGRIVRAGFHRPVDNYGPAHDCVAANESPVAAVPTMVAIVSHREIIIRGNDKLALSDVVIYVGGPFGAYHWIVNLASDRRKIVAKWIVAARIVDSVRLNEHRAIHVNFLISNPNPIARHTDDALHVVLMVIIGKLENDHVAAADFAVGQKMLVPGAVSAKNKFVNQEIIADKKSAFHRGRRNLECLDDKGRAEKYDENCGQKRFDILTKSSLVGGTAGRLCAFGDVLALDVNRHPKVTPSAPSSSGR